MIAAFVGIGSAPSCVSTSSWRLFQSLIGMNPSVIYRILLGLYLLSGYSLIS